MVGILVNVALPPFCCSKALYFSPSDGGILFTDGNSTDLSDASRLYGLQQDDLEAAVANREMVYVDRHIFLHRLYVGLDAGFGTR